MATEEIRGSVGHEFNIGGTRVYAGPGLKGHKLPILAIKMPGDRKDAIVADFRNSSSAEHFIRALIGAIEAASAIPVRAAVPELTEEQAAKVARFGFDEAPKGPELFERIQLLAGGKVTIKNEAVA